MKKTTGKTSVGSFAGGIDVALNKPEIEVQDFKSKNLHFMAVNVKIWLQKRLF